VLDVQEVTVRFGGVKPLDGVSVTFVEGVNGLVGPNGAGKTTMLNVLSGFYKLAGGRLLIDGTDLAGFAPHRRARLGIRRTFQQEQVVKELSAWDNILLTAESLGEDRADVARVVEVVGLASPERRGRDLSMLERRLVEIARTLVGSPRAILLDEPGAGLADADSERLVPLIREMGRRTGTAVVLIDHDMELVSAVCDKLTVLDFGRVIADGPTREVLQDPAVRRAYLGTEDVA
jgi:branched-chain amino acid transport system ATP-binding protein